MAGLKKLTLIACAGFMSFSAHAAPFQETSYQTWLQALEQQAIDGGLSPETVQSTLDDATLDESVIELDQKQPETTVTFDAYSRRILSADRVSHGAEMMDNYGPLLNEIAVRYGVQPSIIVALWGIESNYGRHSGDYSIIDSLLTLAYEGRRADFFRSELLNALRIIDQQHIPSSALTGSWAGAMGQCQFMPSTYLKYAVDYDNRGQADIWQNPRDVFASIANYLAAEGWKSSETWGREVELTTDIPANEIGLDHQHSLAEWQSMGIRNLGSDSLPDKDLNASLIQPDGPDGRSFLVYDNFRALMRWNRSTYFATTVGLLADRIQ